MGNRPIILSIAGYDPSSGAGITADVKTAAAMDCYAVTCVTALTVQSTQGVFQVAPVAPELVRETLYRLAEDVEIAAVRIGMLGSAEVAKVVAKFFRRYKHPNLVLDPVLRSSSGAALIAPEGVSYIRKWLLPVCDVITPNFDEAALLARVGPETSWREDSAGRALGALRVIAARLHDLGSKAVVITGGDLPEVVDFLSVRETARQRERVFDGHRVESPATHGTGCGFATAIACGLAQGRALETAVGEAKIFVRNAIAAAYPVGKGFGPMNHLFRMD
jgi:hydroxymethylpyrimidine/phosphomethylpyrimidine kinase